MDEVFLLLFVHKKKTFSSSRFALPGGLAWEAGARYIAAFVSGSGPVWACPAATAAPFDPDGGSDRI